MRRKAANLGKAALIAAFALQWGTAPARADSIDGDWCLGANHFTIEGPSITTPGGNKITGDYSRHGFAYVVPANEPGAGGQTTMSLLSEEAVNVTRAGTTAAEVWRRCKPTS